jgi:two-component system sensor histidine kinase RpfC
MRESKDKQVFADSEFQSSLVRLGVWGFAVIYIYVGSLFGRYPVNHDNFALLLEIYLLFFVSILVSIKMQPAWEGRRYFSLLVDVLATSCCIYLTGEAASPLFILYVWIFLSYGTRYGRLYLNVASIMSVLAYSAVLTLLDQWGEYFFEVAFLLLALGVLPIYQHSLITKLHLARQEAERSNLVVGQFLSNMTSDMRSPLEDIVTTTKELIASKLDMRQLDKVDEINSSASMLDSVISGVLDFYKVEAGQLQIQSAPFNVRIIMGEVCSAVLRAAFVRQIELVCSVASDVPRVVISDDQRLKQILINSLKSAIDSCAGDELCLSVKMSGPDNDKLLFEISGMAPVSLNEDAASGVKTVFFGEAMPVHAGLHSDVVENFPGNIISLMQGEYGIGTEEDGVLFWFTLPALTGDFDYSHCCDTPSLSGKRAFLFELNKTSREMITTCCRDHGMSVATVESVSELGDKSLEMDVARDVDVVIVADSHRVKSVARIVAICMDIFGKDMPLVVLTYRRSNVDLGEFRRAALVRKPLVQNQLVHAMDSVLDDK